MIKPAPVVKDAAPAAAACVMAPVCVMLLAPVAITVSVPEPTFDVPKIRSFASVIATSFAPLLFRDTAVPKLFPACVRVIAFAPALILVVVPTERAAVCETRPPAVTLSEPVSVVAPSVTAPLETLKFAFVPEIVLPAVESDAPAVFIVTAREPAPRVMADAIVLAFPCVFVIVRLPPPVKIDEVAASVTAAVPAAESVPVAPALSTTLRKFAPSLFVISNPAAKMMLPVAFTVNVLLVPPSPAAAITMSPLAANVTSPACAASKPSVVVIMTLPAASAATTSALLIVDAAAVGSNGLVVLLLACAFVTVTLVGSRSHVPPVPPVPPATHTLPNA